jgi:6-pyruvoyl tetrahydropterin synthase/QueD family protein
MANRSLVRLTKSFSFEAAHALWNYDGPCRNIHGHSYTLAVTITGSPISDTDDPKNGMVMDFSELKSIVYQQVIKDFDHALIINSNTPHLKLLESENAFGKILGVAYQPTCENMVVDIARRISAGLPPRVKLFSLRLNETASSYAEWFASDNPSS